MAKKVFFFIFIASPAGQMLGIFFKSIQLDYAGWQLLQKS